MRYLVKAKVLQDKVQSLLQAIRNGNLGAGSVAGDEYLYDMEHARTLEDGTICWVETCFCPLPLQEERPYWEEFFDILCIKNAHDPRRCRDRNGTEPWACCSCDCTLALEERLTQRGTGFLDSLTTTEEENLARAG